MAVVCTPTALSATSGLLAEELSRKQLLASIVYLLCTLNSMTCTPSALLQEANCLLCLNEKQLLAAATSLLCGIANGGSSGGGGAVVFDAALGVAPDDGSAVPSTPATTSGQTAINESTAEAWFVNKTLTWQQLIGP